MPPGGAPQAALDPFVFFLRLVFGMCRWVVVLCWIRRRLKWLVGLLGWLLPSSGLVVVRGSRRRITVFRFIRWVLVSRRCLFVWNMRLMLLCRRRGVLCRCLRMLNRLRVRMGVWLCGSRVLIGCGNFGGRCMVGKVGVRRGVARCRMCLRTWVFMGRVLGRGLSRGGVFLRLRCRLLVG